MLEHIQTIRQAKGQRIRQCSQKGIANELYIAVFVLPQPRLITSDGLIWQSCKQIADFAPGS